MAQVRTGLIVHAVAAVVVLAALALTLALQLSLADAAPPAHRPIAVRGAGYASSETCRGCHPGQYASWHRSYHRTMTQVADRSNVTGDFSDKTLNVDGREFQLRERDGHYFVRMSAPPNVAADADGRVTLPITLVTGSHHMQVYWYETGYHRLLGQLPAVFLHEEQRWIPRSAAFLFPSSTADAHTSEMGRWNKVCLNCHATHSQPRLGALDEPDTEVAEFGIACEACHGPAQEHVRKQRWPLQRYTEHFTSARVPEIVRPDKLEGRLGSEVCSHCHGGWQLTNPQAIERWRQAGHRYRPGRAHVDQWLLQPGHTTAPSEEQERIAMPREFIAGQFWSDGMARVSGREYNGMIESPCYQDAKYSCMSCHTMHENGDDPRSLEQWADDQLGTDMSGNRACLQCHSSFADKLQEHTLHAPGSSGSLCYNCHMPHTSYGLLKAIRSHKVSTPDVSATIATGRPNACNICHVDKSLGWTAARLHERYGRALPALDDDQRNLPASLVWAASGDAGQRALMAWTLGWKPAQAASGDAWIAPVLATLVDDPYSAVRVIAARSLRALPGFQHFAYDPIALPVQRAPAAARIVAHWRSLQTEPMRVPAALFDPSGEPDQRLLSRLLSQRDNHPVQLLE